MSSHESERMKKGKRERERERENSFTKRDVGGEGRE